MAPLRCRRPLFPTSRSPTASGFERDDLIGAADDLFGQGAQDIARLLERILADQGKPIGYIVGREASGAFVLGVRYGSGVLHHKIEGNRPVYWTGPSIGFDVGGNAAKSFVLVYNLYDTQDLFRRYPQGEGRGLFRGRLYGELSAARRRGADPHPAWRGRPAGGQHRVYEVPREEQLAAVLKVL